MSAYVWPVLNGKITSLFGQRSAPAPGASVNHAGLDISVPAGSSVMAAASGVVSAAGFNSARGNFVEVGFGSGNKAIYQHLSDLGVKVGENVKAGQIIGKSGNSGISTGAHLHFELWENGRAVDPLKSSFLNKVTPSASGANLAGVDLSEMTGVIKKYWYVVAGGLLVVAILK